MRPSLSESKRNDSSESDDESNMRHDRFRSERFKEEKSRSTNFRPLENKHKHVDRYSTKRIRDRSPERSYKRRERTEPSSSYRNELRSNHDRIEIERLRRSKPSKNSRTDRSDKKCPKSNEGEFSDLSKKETNKLSSILRNFDKQLESKRNNSENQLIGPALPPQLREKEDKESKMELSGESSIGPALPPRLMNENLNKKPNSSDSEQDSRDPEIDLPPLLNNEISKDEINPEKSTAESPDQTPHIQKQSTPQEMQKCPQSDVEKMHDIAVPLVNELPETYGPALPPKVETDSYGPALPPNFKKDVIKGPILPSGVTVEQLEGIPEDDLEDEETVGPLPEGKMNLTQYQLDLRAMEIKRKLEEEKTGPSKDIKKREEWMLELPPEKATNLGLGPRSFRMKEAPDMSNRSSWTDTPADKLRKEQQALSGETEPVISEEMVQAAFIQERDEAMEKMSQLSKDTDQPHSLLQMHQKKLKKKKKKEEKEGKKKERRPFDRNIDLQVNRFDDAQKKAIFKKAQLLDTRFSSGQSKYL